MHKTDYLGKEYCSMVYMSSEDELPDALAGAGTLVNLLLKRKDFLSVSQDDEITHAIRLTSR